MNDSRNLVPTASEIRQAAAALRGVVVETPLIPLPDLAERAGAAEVLLKAESLQYTGAFKFRGAYWRCCQLTVGERAAGVVAHSSGNFAQGVAAAARALGVPATIVMPADAPVTKRRRTEGFGAEVILTEHGSRPRGDVASERASGIAESRGMTRLHPYDDPHIVAGHASAALEIVAALHRAGVASPDFVLCGVGGGGFISGLALGLRETCPETELVAVEPHGYDSFGRSLEAGEITHVAGEGTTLCDALQSTAPGACPFACAQAAGIRRHTTVTDDAIRESMRLAFESARLVLEPSGAVGIAALLGRPEWVQGRRVVVVATGGNVDLEDFLRTIGDTDQAHSGSE